MATDTESTLVKPGVRPELRRNRKVLLSVFGAGIIIIAIVVIAIIFGVQASKDLFDLHNTTTLPKFLADSNKTTTNITILTPLDRLATIARGASKCHSEPHDMGPQMMMDLTDIRSVAPHYAAPEAGSIIIESWYRVRLEESNLPANMDEFGKEMCRRFVGGDASGFLIANNTYSAAAAAEEDTAYWSRVLGISGFLDDGQDEDSYILAADPMTMRMLALFSHMIREVKSVEYFGELDEVSTTRRVQIGAY